MSITKLTESDIKDLANAIMERLDTTDGTEDLITIIRDYVQDCKDEEHEARMERKTRGEEDWEQDYDS